MTKHMKYLRYVLLHKWYVFIECCKLGIPWRGLKHDWTKFLPSEWFPYVDNFHGDKVGTGEFRTLGDGSKEEVMEPTEKIKSAFDRAWNHHQKRNSHYWQYWLLTYDKPRMEETMRALGYDFEIMIQYIYRTGIRENVQTKTQVKAFRATIKNTPLPLDMPMNDRKEMLANWKGAGKALGKPDTAAWYHANKDNMFLHPDTRQWIEEQLR